MNSAPSALLPSDQQDPTRPVLLTVSETCASLRISRWTFYRLIQSGQLETVKIGTSRRVPPAALDALVKRLRNSENLR
jgi:excisionase family DNA binding protein